MGTKEGWLLSLLHGIVGPAVYEGNDFYQAVLAGKEILQMQSLLNRYK